MSVISYDVGSAPSSPSVRIRITDTFKNVQFGTFPALVDSGADHTCIPRSIADQATGYGYGFTVAEEFTGRQVQIRVIRILEALVEFLDATSTVVFSGTYANLELPVVESGLLGRDILNSHLCVLDGPGLTGDVS